MLLTHSVGVIAQGIPDIEAPLVELEFVEVAPADINQIFTVQAFDDIGLGDVSLHHRRTGENAFIKTIMTPVGDTGYFSVAIDTDPNDLRSFEYYAQALDLNGNRTVSGFAFDPFVREITAAQTQTSSPVTSAEPQLGGGGGSSDGSTNEGNDSLVPLTVTIGDPLP